MEIDEKIWQYGGYAWEVAGAWWALRNVQHGLLWGWMGAVWAVAIYFRGYDGGIGIIWWFFVLGLGQFWEIRVGRALLVWVVVRTVWGLELGGFMLRIKDIYVF